MGYLVDAVQTCTHYQCFGAKILKISNFFQINFHFFTAEKTFLYITTAGLLNDNKLQPVETKPTACSVRKPVVAVATT